MIKNKKVSGQIGLLLLVVMGVIVSLVLSVASRSLSDNLISRQEKESSAAFSVAETGVENALNVLRQGSVPSGVSPLSDTSGLVSGEYSVTSESSYNLYLKEGETAHLDLTGFAGPTLELYWTKNKDGSEDLVCTSEGSGNAPAAIEINAIQSSLDTSIFSYYNPYNCSIAGNGFASSLDGGLTFRSRLSYTIPSNTTELRIKPIYSSATISVVGAGLATQIFKIQSSASSGDAQREIEVKRGLAAPPSVFDFAVFSAGTIVK